MPKIKPVSDLRNYTEVLNEVSYGSRVHLTRYGHASVTLIDTKELDEIEQKLSHYQSLEQSTIARKGRDEK